MKARQLGVIAAIAIFAGFTPHTRTPQRYALVIGISDYKNFGPEIGGDLPGAANDARDMRNVLVAQKGFDPADIHMILDQEATRARIVSEMDWLAKTAQPGDLVFVSFAGHGSQTWDTTGTEEDGLDETICPTDVVKGDTRNDIVDKDFNKLLKAIPTDNIVVFLDNCHAGSGTRDVTPFARPRLLDRIVQTDVPKPANATAGHVDAAAAAALAAPKTVLELAAAQSDEIAVDAEWPAESGGAPTYNGAFTRNFVRNLWQSPAASYKQIFASTVEDMKRQRFAQHPNLDAGPNASWIDQPAFITADMKAVDETGVVPIMSVGPQGIELGGGAAAGITNGSVYKVGQVSLRVTRVAPGSAYAVAIGGGVKTGDRARLVTYMAADPVLQVSVAGLAPATRAALAAQLKGTPGIALVEGARDFANLLVRPKDNDWAIIGLDGATRHVASKVDNLAAMLSQEAGAHQLASLENPAHPFSLDFSFRNNQKEFKLGDSVEFRAKSSRDGYLTIVDLGTDGKVVVIYPSEATQDNRIKANQEFVLPTGDIRFEAQLPTGRGIVRAFLTDKPLDVGFSQGEATQAALVGKALRKAIGATGTAIPVNNWATASIVYSITK